MTDEQALELGRRAVACAGWRWMPGMLDIVDGDRLVTFRTEGPGCRVHTFRWAKGGWAQLREGHRWIPDLRDAATVGCLLALVREAWDDTLVQFVANATKWLVLSGGDSVLGDASTEAEALVKALESAPKKTSPAGE